MVTIPPLNHPPVKKITAESLFIKSGVVYSVIQILAYVTYGATTTYIAVFADQNLVGGLGGWYFTCMAIGLALSRPFAGKKVDTGNIASLVICGLALAITVSISLFSLHLFPHYLRPGIFLTTAFIQAATSMFFTSNGLGIGIGVLAGGIISQLFDGYFAIFGIGAILCLLSLAIFLYKRDSVVRLMN